jgi:hypothetical protein
MLDSDLAAFVERDHQALDAIVKGDPEPKKRLYSRRDDVTLANPFGPPVRGWQKVAETLERAASQLREGRRLPSNASPNTQRPSLHISSKSSGTAARSGTAKQRRTRCV